MAHPGGGDTSGYAFFGSARDDLLGELGGLDDGELETRDVLPGGGHDDEVDLAELMDDGDEDLSFAALLAKQGAPPAQQPQPPAPSQQQQPPRLTPLSSLPKPPAPPPSGWAWPAPPGGGEVAARLRGPLSSLPPPPGFYGAPPAATPPSLVLLPWGLAPQPVMEHTGTSQLPCGGMGGAASPHAASPHAASPHQEGKGLWKLCKAADGRSGPSTRESANRVERPKWIAKYAHVTSKQMEEQGFRLDSTSGLPLMQCVNCKMWKERTTDYFTAAHVNNGVESWFTRRVFPVLKNSASRACNDCWRQKSNKEQRDTTTDDGWLQTLIGRYKEIPPDEFRRQFDIPRGAKTCSVTGSTLPFQKGLGPFVLGVNSKVRGGLQPSWGLHPQAPIDIR